MSVSLTLDCGCRINEAFVLGMCARHALELHYKKQEDRKAHDAYEEMKREIEKAVSQS